MALPAVTGWDVHVRYFPPLHAEWDPRFGPGTLPAVLVGVLAAWWAVPLAQRLRWWQLLVSAYVGGVAWLFSLAFVDGRDGIGVILQDRVRVPPGRPHDHRLPGSAVRLHLPDPLRQPARRHPERQLAGAHRRPPAGRAGLLRPSRADRSRRRVRRRGRRHPDRGHHRARRDGDAAPARRRADGPPGRTVPGLRPGGDLAGGERGRDVRRGRGVGHRGPRGLRGRDEELETRGLGSARRSAARLLRDAVLRPAPDGAARDRGAGGRPELVAPAVGGGGGPGGGARVRGVRLQLVGGTARAARALLGRRREQPPAGRTGTGATSPRSRSAPGRSPSPAWPAC